MKERLATNHRKEMTDPEAIWTIEEGKGELFIEKESGPLIHLCSLKKGNIFFGFEKDPLFSVILIAGTDMVLKKQDEQGFNSSEEEKCIPQLLDWFHHFFLFFSSFQKEKIHHFLDPDKKYEISEGEAFKGSLARFPEYKKEIRFVQLDHGSAKLFDLENFKIGSPSSPFPLAPGLWMQAEEKLSLHTLSSGEVLRSGKMHEAIKLFQKHLLQLRKKTLLEGEEREKKAAVSRKLQDRGLLESSLKKMGSILSHEETWSFSPLSDPIFKAMSIIGNRLGIHFREPKDLKKVSSSFEKIEKIVRYSKVGFRQVRLVPGWWKKDSLPLLGFYGEEERPVALINRKGSDYILTDPESKKSLKLNEEVAKKLSTQAYSFYAAFPEKKLSAHSLIQFCLSLYKREIFTLLMIGVAGAILSLLPPLFNEYLFNLVIRPFDSTLLAQIIWGLSLSTISISIFMFVRSYAVLRLLQLVDVKLEPAFWNRLLSLPVSFFRQFTVGNLIQRVYAVTDIRQLIGGNVIRVVFSGLFSFFYFIAMLYYSVPLALIGLAVVFLGLLVSIGCLLAKTKIERKIQARDGILRGLVVQLIMGVSKIRMGGAEARAFAHWAKDFSAFQDNNYQSRRYDAILNSVTAFLPTLTTGILFVALVRFSHPLSLGAFIAFLTAYVPFSLAVYDAINTLNLLVPIIPLWERAKVLLDTEPESESNKEKPGILTGQVVLDHVSFQYEKEGALILDQISFHAQPGEFIALVGPSGSGKSTLVRLLLGFDMPLSGSVYYDEKNLSKLDLPEVRRQIGTVLQNGALFSGSIFENIVCGGLYTQKEVQEALTLSGFDKDIETFPMGLHTVVQSGGGALSVGQAQRLLISRALISKPKILIFDEATSALDNTTQDEVSRRLEEIDVTRIVIAHRLSTIRNATRIYVLDKGKISQMGSFLELAQQEGIFKEMLQRQTL